MSAACHPIVNGGREGTRRDEADWTDAFSAGNFNPRHRIVGQM